MPTWSWVLLAALLVGCRPGAEPTGRGARAPHRHPHAAARDESLAARCDAGLVRALPRLAETMHVAAYVPGHLAESDRLAASLDKLFGRLRRAWSGQVDLTIARTDEPGADADKLRGQPAIVVTCGGQREVLSKVFAASELPETVYWLLGKMTDARTKAAHAQHRIGVVVGEGGIGLDERELVARTDGKTSPSVRSVLEEAFPTFLFVSVDVTRAEPIDPALPGLIVTQPGKPWSDAELRRIDDYLMRGGKTVVILASSVSVGRGDATMAAQLDTHNLDRLLHGYGVAMDRDVRFDFQSHFVIPVLAPDGTTRKIHYPPVIEATEDGGPARDGAGKRASNIAPFRRNWGDPGPGQPHAVAAVVEGRMRSAFIPGRRAASSSAVLVVSSGMYTANPFAYLGDGGPGRGADQRLQLFAGPYAQRYLTNAIVSVKLMLDWMVYGRALEPCIGWPGPAWLTPLTAH